MDEFVFRQFPEKIAETQPADADYSLLVYAGTLFARELDRQPSKRSPPKSEALLRQRRFAFSRFLPETVKANIMSIL
jgi:hypothetical protein